MFFPSEALFKKEKLQHQQQINTYMKKSSFPLMRGLKRKGEGMLPHLGIGEVGEITGNASLILKTGTKNSPSTHNLFIAYESTFESLTKTVRLVIARNKVTSEF